jgi:signal transduction histidine kinase
VQEALTNVTRHAHDAHARVHITYGDGDLIVEIDDHRPGVPAAGTPGAGKGIRGMRERAQALGGEPEAGPKDGGGFRVLARLPGDGVREAR